jgi:RNA polymerase sigma factor (sigma-70 family)
MLHHELRGSEHHQAERLERAARRRPPADAGEVERLVLRAAAGDASAWTPLMERFTARVRAVARAHRLAPADADDVVQLTWMRLFEHIAVIREPAAVGAWLGTTARRESLRVLELARREQPAERGELVPDEIADHDPSDDAIAAERRAALDAALGALPPRQRELLTLLADETEPSYAEVSQRLDMPVGSIGPTRGRGLNRLRADAELRAVVQPDAA